MKKSVLAMGVGLLALTGCGASESTTADSLEIFGWEMTADDSEKEMFTETLTEKLGFDVSATVPTDDYEKQLAAALSSGENYDLIYLQQEKYYDLVEQGALLDLSPYIEASETLSDPSIVDPEMYYESIEQDGEVYALPTKYEGGLVATVRKDWLDEFGMDVPDTIEDWEAYFKKCKDEKGAYGVTLRGIDYIQPWMSGFGLQEGLVETGENEYTVPYASDKAAAAWDWWHEMYIDGYLEPNFETNGSSDFRDQFMASQTGSTGYWWHWIGSYDEKVADDSSNPANGTFDTVAAPAAIGPDGEQILSIGDLSLVAIPANSDSPELAIKLMEWLYSDDGSFMGIFGYEGYDYELDADGNPVLTETGESHNLNHGASTPVNGNYEIPDGFENEFSADKEAARAMVDEQGVPVIKNAEWTDINEVIAKYATQAIKGSLTGDEAVAKMQEEISAMSTDEVTYTF